MAGVTSLVRFYVVRPNLFAQHVARGFSVARQGGVGKIVESVRNISSNVRANRLAYVKDRKLRQFVRKRLQLRREREELNCAALVAQLSSFADDLQVLDVIHDQKVQLRVLQAHILKKFALFDESFYKERYLPGVGTIRPLDHYISVGVDEALRPNAVFDPIEYVANYPDCVEGGLDPVLHYGLYGWREGRRASTQFDGEYYLRSNSDVAESGMSPLHHYQAFGRYEGRKCYDDGVRAVAPSLPVPTVADPRYRGTILLVSHDAEIGGAQKIVEVFARWLLSSTRFEVKILLLKNGPMATKFKEIAPIFVFEGHEQASGTDKAIAQMREWAGPDVKSVFLNSVASGRFFSVWGTHTPTISYLHELPKIIDLYGDNVFEIIRHSQKVLGGSHAVRKALVDRYGLPEERSGVVYDFIDHFTDNEIITPAGKPSAKRAIGLEDDAIVMMGCGVVHWRKSPMLFIDVAERAARQTDRKVCFVWIGDGEDFDACVAQVKARGLEKLVKFVGFQGDVNAYLRACDVFLLPSEEDPFPLVCMYAAIAKAPVICFEEAGGMPEFVRQGAGKAVPFLDVDAMAEAVLDYINDDEARARDGEAGCELALGAHTVATTGPQLLHLLREAAGLAPEVSVVVPNYNYENYLPRRLDSILNQTFQDFELILLDDVSPDNSVAVLERYAAKRPGTQLVVNETNSGSPFKQWMKGMALASSDLIWMAEADDYCEPNLLETLVPMMDDRNVFLGYVKSVPVRASGEIIGDYEPLYLDRISAGRWSQSYVATDHDEVNAGLGIANSIPNASSVVMRKFDPDPEFADAVGNMRLCGDWYFYLRAIRGGCIAYSHLPLNYHRRHDSTVTHKLEGSLRYFDELSETRRMVGEHVNVDSAAAEKAQMFTKEDVDRFGITDQALRDRVLREARYTVNGKDMPTLLVVASDLGPGGGQMFSIRLANAWVDAGGRAVLLNADMYPTHADVLGKVSSRVPVVNATDPGFDFEALVENFDIDVVHSSIWWADRLVHDLMREAEQKPKWVVTMHGCYETLIEAPDTDPEFMTRFSEMLDMVDHWAYLTEKNQRAFKEVRWPESASRVNNGYALEQPRPMSRQSLGLRDEATVAILTSRAIESKGWLEAIQAVIEINEYGEPLDLLLLGDGPLLSELRQRELPPYIKLIGHVSNVADYIAVADVGLLPSYFVGESMPLVMIEVLAQGKPFVGSDIGEIPWMLESPEGPAGELVELVDGKVPVRSVARALYNMCVPEWREGLGKRARYQYETHFSMDVMLRNYSDIYASLLQSERDWMLRFASPTDDHSTNGALSVPQSFT